MMKLKSLLISMMLLMTLGFSVASCSSDNDDVFNDTNSTIDLPDNRTFILNEGGYNTNNASISLYSAENNSVIASVYETQNEQKLGDVAQDILYANKSIYVVLNGSKKLIKMNTALVEEASVAIEDSPRYMVYLDGKIYLTVWGKGIQKYDAKTLTLEDTLDTSFATPEDIIVVNNLLYVTNPTPYGATESVSAVSVIDPSTFKVTKTINVWANPQRILEMGGDLYVASNGNYGYIAGEDYIGYQVQRVRLSDGLNDNGSYTIDNLGEFTNMVADQDDDILYLANSTTNWSDNSTITTFSKYEAKNENATASADSFIQDAPAVLASASIYNMTVDKSNGDIYITTTDFVTNGQVYRFDYAGKYLTDFSSKGVNPSHFLFINK